LNRRIPLALSLCALLSLLGYLLACSGATHYPPSGIYERVLASQEVGSLAGHAGLWLLNGEYDVLTSVPPIAAGGAPGLMAISPNRNIVAAFDSSSNSIYSVNTTTEKPIGHVSLSGPTSSFVIPTSQPVGYAAVPSAVVPGFSIVGEVDVMNLAGSVTSGIAVNGAQTLVSNINGSQLLVFSNDSDAITVLNPTRALPGVDLSCYSTTNPPPNSVCTIVTDPNFSRPVFAIINGSTAYIFNCGFECGGAKQASIQTLDLNTLAVGTPILVNGAHYGLLSGTLLYVAGKGTTTGPLCSSLTNPINPKTAAKNCGTLDIVDLTTNTDPYYNRPAKEIAIPDGYHTQMDMSVNGQLFVGSYACTNVGEMNNPSGEVRGCLAIYNTHNNTLIIPPYNGQVDALQTFTTRRVMYVAQAGILYVYRTDQDQLLIDEFIPLGSIDVVGYVAGVKAIDFF
jgi:hypothetical protein